MAELEQTRLIERVRHVCAQDDRLVAALMYGSFVTGEGDAWADIEFLLYFDDTSHAGVDRRVWIEQIAPLDLHFVNEFGVDTAIFSSLVRGEFHFDRASAMRRIGASWKEFDWFPAVDQAIVLDRTGELRRHVAAIAGPPIDRSSTGRRDALAAGFVNWLLFGLTVLERGEHARALDLLGHVQRSLLWLCRLHEGATVHWPTPSRAAECDLSPAAMRRLAACTARLDADSLLEAYRNAMGWGQELFGEIEAPTATRSLLTKVDARFSRESDAVASGSTGADVPRAKCIRPST